jgi:sugar O-acyltransferase (sialic acid O-acetyltransferase NeuD family)
MNTNKKLLIIFGIGKISQAVSYYFNRDSEYKIAAYIVDDIFATNIEFMGVPVVKLSDIKERFKPETHTVFVAVGYQGMNSLRANKYNYFKEQNYSFASYRSPNVFGEYTIGENSIIMDGAIIQPYASFGNNVFIWGGAMVGHHAMIQDDCWLTGGCLIGGSVNLGRGTFIGMGAIVGQEVKTGIECMLGAGSLTIRSIGDKVVVVKEQTETHRLNSKQFTRMSSCFRI